MEARNIPVTQLFSNDFQYIIPIYQRKYNWGVKHCKRLYDDIVNIGNNTKRNSHFIGAITYVGDANPAHANVTPYQIIDGQQRLTTLMLLLAAMRNILIDSGEDVIIKKKIEKLLFNDTAEPESNDYYRMILNKNDDKLFRLILNGDMPKESNNMSANFIYLLDELKSKKLNIETIWLGIRKLNTISVHIKKDGGDNPQEIFESMNSTGLDLSETDLIRNYILMQYSVKEQNEIYENFWHDIEEQFDDEDMDEFIRHYLAMNKKSAVSKRKIYEIFKEYTHGIDMKKEIEKIHKYARHYAELIYENKEPEELKEVIWYIRKQNTNVANSILLKVLADYGDKKISIEDVQNIFNLIDNYLIRCNVCDIGLQAANKVFPELISKIDVNNYAQSIESALMMKKAITRQFPRDDIFIENFKQTQIYSKNKICKYILGRLEHEYSKERVELDNLDIEHIMPQTINADWKGSLGNNWSNIHGNYLHTIGNLTLTAFNSELSNTSFINKKIHYGKSPIHITRELGNYDHWNEDDIKNRAKILSEMAIKIWKCPNEPKNIDDDGDDDFEEIEYLEGKEIQELWYKLKNTILTSYPKTKFYMTKVYGAFKAYDKKGKGTGICGMAAYKNKIYLFYNCRMTDKIIPLSEFVEDVSMKGRHYNGELRSTITSDDDIDKAIKLVKIVWDNKIR